MNKYEIVSGWYNPGGSWCEGSTSYATIPELIEAYKSKRHRTGIMIKRICLTCEYSNSLDWDERAAQKAKDYLELCKELEVNEIYDNFVVRMANLVSPIKSSTI